MSAARAVAETGQLESLTPEWEEAIERVVPAIVSVRMELVHAFEGDGAIASEATGFLVDSERGIVLTNRHVVSLGPGVFYIKLRESGEELPAVPIYRDPIHDFGFLRVDSSRVRNISAIPLNPKGARVGVDIRVVGNDAGERLSILTGTISRLDRNAPEYGRVTYNDLNTFYIGAASSTSGGSSGSPVLSRSGEAVALNAGGSATSANAMYLPLDRITRALDFIQRGAYPPRGDIHTAFQFQEISDVQELGLPDAIFQEVRNQRERGMLVVQHVLVGGVADKNSDMYDRPQDEDDEEEVDGEEGDDDEDHDGKEDGQQHFKKQNDDDEEDDGLGRPFREGYLEAGDILYKVEGTLVTGFLPLEEALDGAMERAMGEAGERWSQEVDAGTEMTLEHVDVDTPPAPLTSFHAQNDTVDRPRSAHEEDCAAAEPAAASNGREFMGIISLQVIRRGTIVSVQLPVADAHALVPRRVLFLGGGALAELSHSRALLNGQPQGTVVLGPTGFVFSPCTSAAGDVTVHSIAGHRVRSLADATAALAAVPEDTFFPIKVGSLFDPSGPQSTETCLMTRRFHLTRLLSRNLMDDLCANPLVDQKAALRRWRETLLPAPEDFARESNPSFDDLDAEASAKLLRSSAKALRETIAETLESTGPSLPSADGEDEDGEVEFRIDPEMLQELMMQSGGIEVGEDGNVSLDMNSLLEMMQRQQSEGGKSSRRPAAGAGDEEEDDDDDEEGGPDNGDMPMWLQQSNVDDDEDDVTDDSDPTEVARMIRQAREEQVAEESEAVRKAAMTLVTVESRIPWQIEGTSGLGDSFDGIGVVVDKERGIVLVDRGCVVVFMSIVTVTIGVLRFPARVLFLHPSANWGLIQIHTPAGPHAKLKGAWKEAVEEIELARVGFRDTHSKSGRKAMASNSMPSSDELVYLLGVAEGGEVVSSMTSCFGACTNVPKALPAYMTEPFNTFRTFNLQVIGPVAENGIAVDKEGRLRGLAVTLDGGLAALAGGAESANFVLSVEWFAPVVRQVIRRIRKGTPVEAREIPCQLDFLSLTDAQSAFGLSARRAASLMNRLSGNELIRVDQIVPGSAASAGLREGDILLDILPPDAESSEVDQSLTTGSDTQSPESLRLESLQSGVRGALLRWLGYDSEDLWWSLNDRIRIDPDPEKDTAAPHMTPIRSPLPITSLRDLMLYTRDRPSIRLRVLRGGREVDVTVHTEPVELRGSSKEVLLWAGMVMHRPDSGLLRRKAIPLVPIPPRRYSMLDSRGFSEEEEGSAAGPLSPTSPEYPGSPEPARLRRSTSGRRVPAGVVCSLTVSGTEAASKIGLAHWVLSIDGVHTPTMRDVLYVVTRIPSGQPARVELAEILNNTEKVVTIRADYLLHPTLRFVHDSDFLWKRSSLTQPWHAAQGKLMRQSSLSAIQDDHHRHHENQSGETMSTLPGLGSMSLEKWGIAGALIATVAIAGVVGVRHLRNSSARR